MAAVHCERESWLSLAGPRATYGQQPAAPYGQPVDNLANQFASMGIAGQKQFQLYTANLLTSPPDPRELQNPPPEIRLPPNSCISPSPTANADPSYQRSTLNAIPTTSSLLTKSKLPLALVLTPYRSLKEGDDAVPVISDTVIARCRRCRTYINPYVQFIDGGNRWVLSSNFGPGRWLILATQLALLHVQHDERSPSAVRLGPSQKSTR